MEEKKIKENEQVEKKDGEGTPEEDSGDGDKPQTTGLVDNAYDAAERLEKAVEAQKAENDRAEALHAKKLLGGTAEAGQVEPEKPRLTDREFAEAVERGEIDPLKEDGYK